MGFASENANAQLDRGPKFDGDLWLTLQDTSTSKLVLLDKHGDPTGASIPLPGAGPHITTFSPSNNYAYVGGMVDGKLYVIDAWNRTVVTSLPVGPTLTHQARPSPDGSTLLVSVLSTRQVVKVAVDEANQTWNVVGSVSTEVFGKPPICTIFREDGNRAYVSLNPNGIAIVDVPTMTILGSLPTDGFVACGMIKSDLGNYAVIAAGGGGGHIYTLDMNNDTLVDRGTVGAASWHSFIMTEDETLGFGSSPLDDRVHFIDLTQQPVASLGSLVMNAVPTTGANQPDAFGGGEKVSNEHKTLAVTLRAAGKIGFVNTSTLELEQYETIAPPTTFNPATCAGCAVHGVTVHPDPYF